MWWLFFSSACVSYYEKKSSHYVAKGGRIKLSEECGDTSTVKF